MTVDELKAELLAELKRIPEVVRVEMLDRSNTDEVEFVIVGSCAWDKKPCALVTVNGLELLKNKSDLLRQALIQAKVATARARLCATMEAGS